MIGLKCGRVMIVEFYFVQAGQPEGYITSAVKKGGKRKPLCNRRETYATKQREKEKKKEKKRWHRGRGDFYSFFFSFFLLLGELKRKRKVQTFEKNMSKRVKRTMVQRKGKGKKPGRVEVVETMANKFEMKKKVSIPKKKEKKGKREDAPRCLLFFKKKKKRKFDKVQAR